MRTSPKMRLVVVSLLCLLTACSTSPNNHYFVLTPSTEAASTLDESRVPAPPKLSVVVPAYIDRPQIVFIDANGNADIHEYDRWIEPIDGMLQRILLQDIQAAAASARQGNNANITVALTVDSFEFDGSRATLKAHWSLTNSGKVHADTSAGTRQLPSYAFSSTVASSGPDLSSMVSTMSELTDALAKKIVQTFRSGRSEN